MTAEKFAFIYTGRIIKNKSFAGICTCGSKEKENLWEEFIIL